MSTLEALIRETLDRGGKISVLRMDIDDSGHAAASVFDTGREIYASRRDCDPIAALTTAMIEFDRKVRDIVRAKEAARDPAQLELEDAMASDFEALL